VRAGAGQDIRGATVYGKRTMRAHAPNSSPPRRPVPTLVLALALASCATSPLPRPRLPQVEQATEAVHGGGERYRAHRTCAGVARSVDDLVRCMRDAGWAFVAGAPGYPEADCWRARDGGEVNRIPPDCFVRTPEHRGTAAP